MHHYLRPLIAPESVALIGASDRAGSLGCVVLENLLSGGFGGADGAGVCNQKAHGAPIGVARRPLHQPLQRRRETEMDSVPHRFAVLTQGQHRVDAENSRDPGLRSGNTAPADRHLEGRDRGEEPDLAPNEEDGATALRWPRRA